MKTCTGCQATKPLSEFFRDKRTNGRIARCKSCKKAAARAWKERNPEHDSKRYWANRDSERERHLVRKYGVTFADYARMLTSQGGRCAICQRTEPSDRMFDVDHCHATGVVRGLLCTSCNRVLGHAGDSPETLLAAAIYLEAALAHRSPMNIATASRHLIQRSNDDWDSEPTAEYSFDTPTREYPRVDERAKTEPGLVVVLRKEVNV